MNRAHPWRIVALAVGVVAPAHALAGTQAPATSEKSVEMSASQMFDMADRAVTDDVPKEAEAIYGALSTNRDVAIRSEARFRLALLFSRQKRYSEAAVVLRRILDEQPTVGRVRIELARVLALGGEQRAALRELRQAAAGDLPPDVALIVKQVTQAYRQQRPYGAAIEVALAPDSNINRATRSETLDTVLAPLQLSPDARERSGLGLKLSGQVYARVPLSAKVKALVRATGQASLYRATTFDDVAASGRIGAEWTTGQWLARPTIGRSYHWFGGTPYAVTDSGEVEVRHALGPRAQIEVDVTGGFSHYQRNPLQTGRIFDLSLVYERALTPRSGFSLSVSGERQHARDPAYATRSGGGGATYWHDVGRTTVSVSGTYRRLESDAAFFLFGDKRREDYVQVGAAATLRQFEVHGFAPIVRATFERNASTIALYDYRRTAFEFGITRAF